MSSQTMTDIDRLIYGLENLQSILGDVDEGYTNKVDLLSLLTLLVENRLFAEMRGGRTDTPRQMLKRLTTCSAEVTTPGLAAKLTSGCFQACRS